MSMAELAVEIVRVEGCRETKRRILAVLRQHAGELVYISTLGLDAPDRHELIATLQRSGMTRAEVVGALSARLGVSPQTARRWVRGHSADR